MSSTATARTTFSIRRYLVYVLIAAVVNALIWVAAVAVGAGMRVTMSGGMDVALPAALVATAIPLAIAGTAAWLVTRRWPRLRPAARVTGSIVAVASAVIPFTVAVDVPTGIALAAMHLCAGAAWFLGTRTPSAPA